METNYEINPSQSQLYCGLVSTITTTIYSDRNTISIYERLYTDGWKDYAWHNSERQIKMNVCKQTRESNIALLKMRLIYSFYLKPNYIWYDRSSFTYVCASQGGFLDVTAVQLPCFWNLDDNSLKYCWFLGICAFGPSGKYEILVLIESKLIQSGFNKV